MKTYHWVAIAFLILGVAKFAHSMGWIGEQHTHWTMPDGRPLR